MFDYEIPQPKIIVGPDGPLDAKIGLIGEAPGAIEIRLTRQTGRSQPFVGPSGSLLNQLLSSARISRQDCYITNVIKEQPPKTSKKTNDVSVFLDLETKPPKETDAYKVYKQLLKEELEKTSINLFIAFGNVPLYALTGIYPPSITKRRGSIYECTLVPGRKVLATIHPAACIHQGGEGGMYMWRYFILHDLHTAKRECVDRVIHTDDIEIITRPSMPEIKQFLESIPRSVSFDIEVVNLEVSCISIAFQNAPGKTIAMSIPFTSGGQEYMSIDDEAWVWDKIARILEDTSVRKIGQNLIFDTQFLFRKYGIVTKNIDDTMIAHGVLIPDFPKGLDYINSAYTKIPYYKDEGKKYYKIGGDEQKFWEYNAKDSIVCEIAFPAILSDLKTKGNEATYERQKKLVEVLACISERGIRVDNEGIKKEQETVGKKILELNEMLNRMAGREINWNSNPQVIVYLYGEKGYKPYIKRGTGKPTVDEDAIKRLARSGCTEASILLQVNKLDSYKTKYLNVSLDEDGRLRGSYNPVGAADTGRLSSGKTIWETGMNLQNILPEFKKHMLFDTGYIGYSLDLEQVENRIVAYIAPEAKMIQAFEERRDVHCLTAGLILDKNPEDVSDSKGSCPFCEYPDLCGHTERGWGKQSNHAFNYGRGYASVALKLDIQEALAKRIRLAYHNAYPGVQIMWSWIQEELQRTRTLTNLFGRKRLFMAQWGDDLFREAYAFIPSSTVADKIDEQGLQYIYYNQDEFKHIELLNQIHDSIVFQIPISAGIDYHINVVEKIQRSLETPLTWKGKSFPTSVGIEVGTTSMSKSAMKKVKTMDDLRKYLELYYHI